MRKTRLCTVPLPMLQHSRLRDETAVFKKWWEKGRQHGQKKEEAEQHHPKDPTRGGELNFKEPNLSLFLFVCIVSNFKKVLFMSFPFSKKRNARATQRRQRKAAPSKEEKEGSTTQKDRGISPVVRSTPRCVSHLFLSGAAFLLLLWVELCFLLFPVGWCCFPPSFSWVVVLFSPLAFWAGAVLFRDSSPTQRRESGAAQPTGGGQAAPPGREEEPRPPLN